MKSERFSINLVTVLRNQPCKRETEAVPKDQTSDQPDVQMKEQVETDNQSEEQQVSANLICDGVEVNKKQLMKELEQTQKELSRLQQLNKSLQVELQQEKKSRPQDDSSSQSQAQFFQLQRLNHDLRSELETLKREQEEAREAELRRRVDLLAQQAQLLVTGDATALAQVQLEQDRRKFFELQGEWERCIASLQSQLDSSEEQKKEAQQSLTKLQLELERFRGIQQENEGLHKQLEEATRQLSTNEEAQAQKEACLEKHLVLLQASQDRERKSLASSLRQAEQHAKDLQQRLDTAEKEVLNMNKTEAWAAEIEGAKEELEEELRSAVSDAKKLQEEREHLQHRCEELQNQFSAADQEVSRLESCLKTSETHYCSLKSSYEEVCEELQGALKKVQQRESEARDMQEGYKRLLDRKEQEVCEVLLKMEILGNSLEETEVKLNEVLSRGSGASSQLKDESSEPAQQMEGLTDGKDVSEDPHRARITSCSSDSTYRDLASVEEDQERFMSVIQVLESKLFVTEEKLRDIMQRLEEHQSDAAGQDPTLCSQLTQSRASTQHLSLLLHSQAKKNQRFAQETENCCRLLSGRFQVALNIIQACRERLQSAPVDAADFEKQLSTVAACLQQAEGDAERHRQESCSISRGEDKILNDEPAAAAEGSNDAGSVERYLKNEIFVVEHMVSVLQSEHAEVFSLAPREDEEAVIQKFISIIRQRINLRKRAEYDRNTKELDNTLEGAAWMEEEVEAEVSQGEMDPEPGWLEGILSRLKRRVTHLQRLAQEISDDRPAQCHTEDAGMPAAAADPNWILEEARLIYLSERLKLDLEQRGKERDITTKDGQETLTDLLYGLGEDNCRLGEELDFPRSVSQKIPQDMQEINIFHEKRLRKLQKEFEERVTELQQIHDEEMKHLQAEGFRQQKEGGDAADLGENPQVTQTSSPPDRYFHYKPADSF
ncbi:unnamed protein product [Tetraodon nigroviridis]|uniref:(spotted green pufferfish) hypothetical protein n=1 Tax=Tetraodon nigroviridis TaxID=99883 RepID=Q4S9H3_TETNG|nr:unnamed protein product [Tetraodon nigroviridis]